MTDTDTEKPQTVSLLKGGQAIINGALVTAGDDCTLEVGSGAFVLCGRALWRDREAPRNPREELYFSMVDAGTSEARFTEERFRLFALLSQVVAQDRTHSVQKECALCASALMAGNSKDAIDSAARLASERLASTDRGAGRKHPKLPGQKGVQRVKNPVQPPIL